MQSQNTTLIDLRVPDFGGTDAIELVEWQVSIGDEFSKDQELCDFVTDKASFCLEAPQAGKIEEILSKNNSIVKAGDLVAKAIFYSDL